MPLERRLIRYLPPKLAKAISRLKRWQRNLLKLGCALLLLLMALTGILLALAATGYFGNTDASERRVRRLTHDFQVRLSNQQYEEALKMCTSVFYLVMKMLKMMICISWQE